METEKKDEVVEVNETAEETEAKFKVWGKEYTEAELGKLLVMMAFRVKPATAKTHANLPPSVYFNYKSRLVLQDKATKRDFNLDQLTGVCGAGGCLEGVPVEKLRSIIDNEPLLKWNNSDKKSFYHAARGVKTSNSAGFGEFVPVF